VQRAQDMTKVKKNTGTLSVQQKVFEGVKYGAKKGEGVPKEEGEFLEERGLLKGTIGRGVREVMLHGEVSRKKERSLLGKKKGIRERRYDQKEKKQQRTSEEPQPPRAPFLRY